MFKESILIPPPGVVIYNSKANSGRFVGSPCIVQLYKDTYIASHDLFGKSISNTHIYITINSGESWEKIATIENLNWSTLFLLNNKNIKT